MLISSLSFGQVTDNLSKGSVNVFTIPVPGSPLPSDPIANEVFRFLPGLVTQGTTFGFSDQWFALGKIASGQSFYGLRFQNLDRGLTMGYVNSNGNSNKPRIQWIHNGGSTAGYLEFRVGNGFGGSGGPGGNTLVL